MPGDYSQWGEQQIIRDILSKLPNTNRWCVDVGAGDGETLSNTKALLDEGYRAVLIEGHSEKYKSLSLSTRMDRHLDNAILVNIMVRSSGAESLDGILLDEIPQDFDFLSIDIDGNDYHIWKNLTNYRPKVVSIEFNPTISADLIIIQEDESPGRIGASIPAMVALRKEKGYELAAVTVTNAIFVRSDLYPLLGIEDNSIPALWTNRCFMTWDFYGCNGQEYKVGYGKCPWFEGGPVNA